MDLAKYIFYYRYRFYVHVKDIYLNQGVLFQVGGARAR